MQQKHNPMTLKVMMAVGIILVLASVAMTGQVSAGTSTYGQMDSGTVPLLQESTPEPPTVDHTSLDILQGPFDQPQEVTAACLSCHSHAAEQLMETVHWTWEFQNDVTGQLLGKKNLINNFCISIQSNEPRCTSCHIGYGWEDNTFDFTEEKNVDCLVCHDTTGTYQKFPTSAGYPTTVEKEFPAGSGIIYDPVDLAYVAQNIGPTSRETCGNCHFYGGGGDYVKHGDMDSSLIDASYQLDVHMSPEGADMNCTTCHMTDGHQISGSRYEHDEGDWEGCATCHSTEPHNIASLNNHTEKVACQTCHIPEYARGGNPTKMTWDWSQAGQLNASGAPITTTDENGLVIYDGKKGAFTFEYDVIPDYVWYNGNVTYTLPGEEIDPSTMVNINTLLGDKDDPNAKIYPVKTFTAIQPYDSGNNILAIPHLYGSDDAAYWKSFNWDSSIAAGMAYAGLDYSGSYDFVETQMLWPTTHMVAPASEALSCQECHTGQDSRLNFISLGYSEEDVTRLTNFPPSTNFEDEDRQFIQENSPDVCESCHTTEHELWTTSTHSTDNVGCVSCHTLEQEGEHPQVAFTMSKDAAVCGSCHINEYRDWENSIHKQYRVTCVTCHNPHSQDQMTVGDYEISCLTCHQENAEEIAHSTHKAAGLNCNDCHMYTGDNTGHTWNVGSDTCLSCHADTIHQANSILTGEGTEPLEETVPVEEPVEPSGTGFSLPIWAGAFFGIVIFVGGAILFVRRDNGNGQEE